ncbi:PRA1 family protein H [Prunus yedoensis var. nudiflora]|uniref:PRA1 family protein n=1 Tax=Prunus yedoensis var. nudiflora TaxID=2094558 RepID=A0A315ADE7_PRUYE|nr:PRA1 family protein H [Prunus yedoensis var. nudiflora]
MVFTSNPLSLSVPDPFFESWLRENGYPEIIDQHTSTAITTSTTTTTDASSITNGFFISLFSRIFTLLSLFTINPFSKLTNDDLAAQTPPWTTIFIGSSDSYSFPLSVSQARMRVQENVKRYARNYATLFVLFFACSLYQMPLALVGLISCLALWDVFKFCSERWGLDRYPIIRECLIRVAQCVAAVILICSNVQMALFYALGVSYAGMILHAGFRKLVRAKQTPRGRSK